LNNQRSNGNQDYQQWGQTNNQNINLTREECDLTLEYQYILKCNGKLYGSKNRMSWFCWERNMWLHDSRAELDMRINRFLSRRLTKEQSACLLVRND